MFSKKDKNLEKIDTIIGKNTKLEGKMETTGTIRLDGELIGDLNIKGNLIVGENGKIDGNIIANNVLISGIVNGNITCNEQLRLTNTAKLYGDIIVKSFIVDENAVFEGTCKMQSSSNIKEKDSQNNNSNKNKGAK
ncbi:bactofilin family protein [Thermohalobacter berrensis]|uniref:Cell shape determination protein CcmA n=1 Tax=Thermohalobacter berrensis TaxID=99594 RepID=A0A419T1Y1_9FIRM|nr:polymer-forming cytoskeletal protein [Thermohalobacter berrensis]RKD31452.1 cell shape determination protein CcmA [Thermohalobacter berrensis]